MSPHALKIAADPAGVPLSPQHKRFNTLIRQAVPRRKSAAQQRRDADAQAATQSVREVFRKLASALHPDR